MVAFSGFYENHKPPPSGNACGIVPPHHDGHQKIQQRGYMLHHRFVDCFHGGRWGDTEHEVVARWQRPGAYGGALDMLHRAMPRTLLQRLRVTIEMACEGGHIFLPLLAKHLIFTGSILVEWRLVNKRMADDSTLCMRHTPVKVFSRVRSGPSSPWLGREA